jgi:hypothetical protein
MRGAKINRPKKFKKKSAAIDIMGPMLALNGTGMGHSLSITYEFRTTLSFSVKKLDSTSVKSYRLTSLYKRFLSKKIQYDSYCYMR